MNSQQFIIRRVNGAENVNLTIPSALPYGALIGFGASKDTGAVAGVDNFVGFLSRDVTTDGPTLSEIVLPTDRLELPAKVGSSVTVYANVEEFELENDDLYVLTSTGDISAGAVGTKCAVRSGKIAVAQSGEIVRWTIGAVMTPVAGGTVRFLLIKA